MKGNEDNNQIKRIRRHLEWVSLGDMKVSPAGQRTLNQEWVNYLAANMSLEELGNPEVNRRDGSVWIMDGQHRVEGLKMWLGEGWEKQKIQCWVTVGLTEAEEAETFLRLNNRKNVSAFDKFTKAITAGRQVESDIERQMIHEGLRISRAKQPGAVGCVAALTWSYVNHRVEVFGKTVRTIRDSFGDPGFKHEVVTGLSLFYNRYSGAVSEEEVIRCLSAMNGGQRGFLTGAEGERARHGKDKRNGVAAQVVATINASRKKRKLPSWWKEL